MKQDKLQMIPSVGMMAGVLQIFAAMNSASLQIWQQSVNCTYVNPLRTNFKGLDQKSGDVESLTFPNHYNTSSLPRVMGKWIHSSCLQEENFMWCCHV